MWGDSALLRIYGVALALLYGCSSAEPTIDSTPLVAADVNSTAPCWINRPDCVAIDGERALYFVGQSDSPRANAGRPDRQSIHSARRDAELEYARFLGVDIESSATMRTVFNDEIYRLQFNEDISEDVSQRVGALIKVDQYNVAHQRSPEGHPLWTVFVLLKVSESDVIKHRLAVTEERSRAANMPSPPDEWVARLFNIDDSVSIYVNETKVNQCDLLQNCKVNLTPHFKDGLNSIRLEYRNEAFLWTYAYEILRNGEVMYKAKCGQVLVFGCGFLDMKRGIVHEFDFEVDWGR